MGGPNCPRVVGSRGRHAAPSEYWNRDNHNGTCLGISHDHLNEREHFDDEHWPSANVHPITSGFARLRVVVSFQHRDIFLRGRHDPFASRQSIRVLFGIRESTFQ
jgi:hypothetical protein